MLFLVLLQVQACPADDACDAQVAAIYADGMAAARKASAEGGSVESLCPVRAAAAYERAATYLGLTPRIQAGLAKAAR